jgi:hypothetical protein
MKDQVTGQIKTVSIKVNGPIALVITTTSIDESEDQTKLIHEKQRLKRTLEGYMNNESLNKIKEKHIYAQRLLKKVNVFNPFAPLLTFPSSRLQTRRDNEKMLKLVDTICFLHQYQRKIKRIKLDNNKFLDYIECTVADYKIAYELLQDGILDNTLDDLPRPARELLEVIKKYLNEKNKAENTNIEKIVFTRKDIREYSSWSYNQIRNNFDILKEYEYLTIFKTKNGLANQYRLAMNYTDIDFINRILTPQELENKIKESNLVSVKN